MAAARCKYVSILTPSDDVSDIVIVCAWHNVITWSEDTHMLTPGSQSDSILKYRRNEQTARVDNIIMTSRLSSIRYA